MKEKPTTIYVVRHGTTALNQKYCFQGWIDEPLNELGLKQGACLYERFKDIPIDLAVSSPLQRATKTMELLLGDRLEALPIQLEDDLRELYGGAAEGVEFHNLNTIFPGFTQQFSKTPGLVQMPDGECTADVDRRVSAAFYRLAKEHPGKTIVVTMHGFALGVWINHALGNKVEALQGGTMDNVAVSKFIFDHDGNVHVEYVGDSKHLPDELKENYNWKAINNTISKPIFVCYPKCSTCKKAKKFLDEHQIDYLERHIVDEKLWPSELQALMNRFEGKPRQFFNTSGMKYREMGLKDKVPGMTPEEMIALLSTDGMLVKRPILITPKAVLVGFKQEKWEAALSDYGVK